MKTQCAALLAVTLAASPSAAIDDISGEWIGKRSCDITNFTGSAHFNQDVVLYVDQLKKSDVDSAFAYLDPPGFPLRLVVTFGASKGTRARVAGHACDFSEATGGYVFHASANIKSGSDKGAMTGKLIDYHIGQFEFVTVCHLKLRRIRSTIDAPLSCPGSPADSGQTD
jgi:hypothetical protein